jgi:hypothetical protein
LDVNWPWLSPSTSTSQCSTLSNRQNEENLTNSFIAGKKKGKGDTNLRAHSQCFFHKSQVPLRTSGNPFVIISWVSNKSGSFFWICFQMDFRKQQLDESCNLYLLKCMTHSSDFLFSFLLGYQGVELATDELTTS